MNAWGLNITLMGVSGLLGMPFFQTLVTEGSIKQDELDGTRSHLSSVATTLKNTPPDKIEALVAQYDEQLTAHSDKVHSYAQDLLGAFRGAQLMLGHITTIMGKSRIKG
jgi:hypothetical protein